MFRPLDYHFPMMSDEVRNRAYHSAIRKAVEDLNAAATATGGGVRVLDAVVVVAQDDGGTCWCYSE